MQTNQLDEIGRNYVGQRGSRARRIRLWASLTLQRIRERKWIVQPVLIVMTVIARSIALTGNRFTAVNILCQVHRTTRWEWLRQVVEPYIIANRHVLKVDSVSYSSAEVRKFFGSRFLVLKPPGAGGEKGVLLVMFTEMCRLLQSSMNVAALLRDYTLVLEPSWSGYCSRDFLPLTSWNDDIFVLAAESHDFSFLLRLKSNLIPVSVGPCDWVDPRVASPYLDNGKEYDILMNSNWAAWKRHYVLFRMLAKARRKYKVALIGGKWGGRTRSDIEALASFYGVRDQVTIFERLPYEAVMDITCQSRVSILLSLKEGSNRAIPESMFCNVPVIVLSAHVGGVRKNVLPQTGLLVAEDALESAVVQLLDGELKPRDWAIQNISCFQSSERLNSLLRHRALSRGMPWTRDIAGRSNSPESKYVDSADAERLAPWNEKLSSYLQM